MPGEFSAPPGVKIPKPVSLENADPERKRLYEGLTSVDAKLPEPAEVAPQPAAGIPPPPRPRSRRAVLPANG